MAPEAAQPGRHTVETSLSEVARLLHGLNNQLGVILANAELLETRATSESERARAAQVVTGALDAIASVQQLRRLMGAGSDRPPDGLNPSVK